MRDQIKLISQACMNFKRKPSKIPFIEVPVVRAEDVQDNIFTPNCALKKNAIDNLAQHYELHIVIILGQECITSCDRGVLVFMHLNPLSLLRFHTNLGRILKLPSGLGKFSGPIHELNEILKAKNIRTESNVKNFNMQSNLAEIEDQYDISLIIWKKCRQNFNKCKISRVRDGSAKKRKLHLHLDDKTQKLFLILDRKLYFRGYLKRLHNSLL